jgi:hypothetical protein
LHITPQRVFYEENEGFQDTKMGKSGDLSGVVRLLWLPLYLFGTITFFSVGNLFSAAGVNSLIIHPCAYHQNEFSPIFLVRSHISEYQFANFLRQKTPDEQGGCPKR